MSDAIKCDRCGSTGSTDNRFWGRDRDWTVKYKSMHKPVSLIGSRNRTLDLCEDCRREMDKFLGLGCEPHELAEDDD
jgi:hypothetical protein